MKNSFTHRVVFLVILQQLVGCAPSVDAAVPGASAAVRPQSASTSVASTSPPSPGYPSFAGTMPTAVTSFGATAAGKFVYVLGGYSGAPHHYTKEGQSDSFARFNADTGAWETLASLGKMQSATLDPIAGKLVRIGGMRVDNNAGSPVELHSVADVDLFDVQTLAWTKASPLPEARSSHGTAVIGDKIYVIGGWALHGGMDSGTWASTMLVGHITNGTITWTAHPADIRSRALGVAALGHQVVAVGGMNGRRVQRTTHLYDTRNNTWSIGPEFPEPAFGVAITRMGDRLFASGASGTVYVLNASQSAWEPFSQLTFPRFFHAIVAVEERLLFMGGVPGTHEGDRVRHIEQVGPARIGVHSWTLPAASAAKNRQGAFLSGNGLFVFGGNKALGQHDFASANFLQESYRLDLGSFAWTPLEPFPNAAQSMQAVVTSEGLAVASGGFGPKGRALSSSPEVFHYDLSQGKWSQAGAFPESRTQFGFAEHNGALWVFGGMTFDDTNKDAQFRYPTTVLRRQVGSTEPFVPSEVTTPRARRAFAWSTIEDNFYMIGGMAEGFGLVSECDVFDFVRKTWTQVECPSRVRIGAEMLTINGKLYLIAGRSKSNPDAELADDPRIEVYDPRTQTWTVLVNELPIKDTHQLRAFAFRDKILLYTAQREDQQVQIVLIDPQALSTSTALLPLAER